MFVVIFSIWAILVNNSFIIVQNSGIVGIICILLSAIFSNALNSGDRIRANHSSETKEDRQTRVRWSLKIALVGLPNVVAAIVAYTWFR
ncbi:DUF5316 domain-containing protein [Brevibacillus borstelensis]|uniref:DUF5316 domain-containing protein n=1 Tax=Brevibacillus borstelensis TaxID=45462 RepID=UPI003CC92153